MIDAVRRAAPSIGLAPATPMAAREPGPVVDVFERQPSSCGGWTEHLRDRGPIEPRPFLPCQVQKDPELVAAFGTATPPSSEFLLHYAGAVPPGVARRPVPVLLIHGAKVDGHFWWHAPHGKHGPEDDGMAQTLRRQGFDVYAVTFAHNQDDNFVQAQQVADAIARVRALSGASQVDLVGHSKGCIPSRMYVTPAIRQPWMTPFQNDVRRLVLLGGPNGGIDYFFRHPKINLAQGANNWPMSWKKMRAGGVMEDFTDRGYSKAGPSYWLGQLQMLRRWDGVAPVTDDTERLTYHGGKTDTFEAVGIAPYIEESGHFMDRLIEAPVAPGIEVALLAGNKPDVPGFENETAAPSDGIIFVESALQAPKNARVLAADVLPLNHLELAWSPAGRQWLSDRLASEDR